METENQKEEQSSERLSAVVRSLQARNEIIRVWCIKEQKMIEDVIGHYQRWGKHYLIYQLCGDPFTIELSNINDYVIMRSNITDCNNINIFVGDIYTKDGHDYSIMTLETLISLEDSYINHGGQGHKSIRIDGNIFETPELLE